MFKRLLFVALVAAAAWYGWKNYKTLLQDKEGSVEVVNHSGRAVERVRVSVGSRTVVFEVLEDGASARQNYQPPHDGVFELTWKTRGVLGDRSWSGGTASGSPPLMRHRFEFDTENGVVWTSEEKSKR